MHKEDLALNNLRWWICRKTKPNKIEVKMFLMFHRTYLNIINFLKTAF